MVRVPIGAERAGPAGGSKSTQEGAASKVTTHSAGSRLAHHASAKKRTQLLPRVAKDIVVKREGGHGNLCSVKTEAATAGADCKKVSCCAPCFASQLGAGAPSSPLGALPAAIDQDSRCPDCSSIHCCRARDLLTSPMLSMQRMLWRCQARHFSFVMGKSTILMGKRIKTPR